MHISEQRKLAGYRNREAILRYLLDNPGVSQTQIADKFGLSRAAVCVHIKHIRKGWRPLGWVDVSQNAQTASPELDLSNE